MRQKAPMNCKQQIDDDLARINDWLKTNKLSLNIAKTEYMIIGSRQKLQTQLDNDQFCITIDDKQIKRVDHTKSLGLHIDKNLSWAKHIEEISKKVSSAIGALKRIRPFINTCTAVKIYRSLIEPHLRYCSPVWDGMAQYLSDKLQKLQNRAARVITKTSYDASSSHILDILGWNKLSSTRAYDKSVVMHKALNNLAPDYLGNMFQYRNYSYSIRDSILA